MNNVLDVADNLGCVSFALKFVITCDYAGAGAYREVDTRVSDRRVEIRWSKSGIPLPR